MARNVALTLLFIAGLACLTNPASGQSKPAAANDPALKAGFRAMYALNFAESKRQFADYVQRHPDDPLGYAAQAAEVLFAELDRLHALDAEFYVDDKHLLAETKGSPDTASKKRLHELTDKTRKLADKSLDGDNANESALFALAIVNGLEADYAFLVAKDRRAAAKPGRAGYDYAKRLIAANPSFHDAYIWTGVTNYVVASLPFPIRWLAKLRGYPASKETAIDNLRSAAEKGGLLRPYARILLAVTFLRENRKREARDLLLELSTEFPENPHFRKHAERLSEADKSKKR